MNYAPGHAHFNDVFDNFFVAVSNQPQKKKNVKKYICRKWLEGGQTRSEPCTCTLKNGKIFCTAKENLGMILKIEKLIYPTLSSPPQSKKIPTELLETLLLYLV